MNSVAPCSCPTARSPSVTATGMSTGTLLPRKLGDSGRGRSVTRSRTDEPASSERQKSKRICNREPDSSLRCHSA